ncbi:sulfurtransferase [Planosporangium sp. 12N6]|uniref:sulfurtransferase n=1 Tax=Planosporangium spinosum TaxID=3402278 RepID=UPI003CF97423
MNATEGRRPKAPRADGPTNPSAGLPPFVDTIGDLDPRTVLVDVRWGAEGRPGRDAYRAGHLPGAVFCDFEADLLARIGGHPAGLPAPEDLAAMLGRLGIATDTPVVAYDDLGGVAAARLVWMLRTLGQPAAVLAGGLAGYAGTLDTGDVTPVARAIEARPWPANRVADLATAVSPDVRLMDARPASRYRGLDEPGDARGGHIPGAVNVFWRDTLDADGRLLPADRLRDLVDTAQREGSGTLVCYCGNGAGACHLLLAFEHAGLPPGQLYAGSWTEYSATDLPVAR